ncbi:uncharacterized protein Fot_42182 [Forsythia ovata]|uniref:Uncharacterized protein n=1 Tax=Forsythia ovata TaxID=205694 RepID=A0ABD1RKG0_9LAMI
MRSDLKNRSANGIRTSPANTKRLKSVEDLANPCSSSSRGSCFKENVNINKSDATKLSAEPLQMKRKKRGGGYNLRKSLAWDRAFFTEEGVLDPIELSSISGASRGEGLCVIDEEISGGSSYTIESADIPAIENDLIKELSDEVLDKYKRNDCLSPKPDSSAPNDVISTSTANSLQKGHLSINTSPMLVHRADNSGSKMILDNMAPVTTVHSSESRDESTAVPVPIAQGASISGRNMHPSPSQATRPSGLRMPSPSLAFFGQPKTSVSYSLSWRNTDSNVRGIKKLEDIRSRNTLTKIPKMANDTSASTSNSNRAVSSRSECSAPFDVSAVSCEIIESYMEKASVQKVGMKVLYDVNNSEPKGNTIDVNVQIQDLKQTETGKIISQDDIELRKNDKEYCLQSSSCEKVTGDNNLKTAILRCPGNRESCMSGWGNSNLISQHNCLMLDTSGPETKDATNEPHKGPNICKLSVSKHDIRSGDVNDHRWQNSLTMESNLVETCMQDWHEPPREQTDQLKFSLEETNQGPNGAKHILKTNGTANEPAEVSQEYGSCYTAHVDFEALESNMKSSRSASKHGHNDLSIKTATGDVMIYDLHVGRAQLQAPEDILTIESCTNNINHIPVVGASNEQSGKASEVKDVCQEVELDLQKNNKLHATDWLLPENQVCCIKSLQEKLTETLPVVDPAGKDGNQLFNINMEISQAPAAVHDTDFNIGKMIGQPLNRDIQFNSVGEHPIV